MKAVRSLVVAVLVVATVGCAASREDKAGGSADGKPSLLTFETVDRNDPVEFAAAVRRLSGGSLRIRIDGSLQSQRDGEGRIARHVERGTFDLGVVGARYWDTRGVTTLRALVAPFLVDSLALEQQVLESPLAARMLAGLSELDLVGVAFVPGALRHPLGVSGSITGTAGYPGTTMGIATGGVARSTVRALGATPRTYLPGFLSGLDGAELDEWTIAFNGYDLRASTLTANVTLWPRVQTVVMNREAYDALTPEQRDVLLRAGAEAVAPAIAAVKRRREEAVSLICRRQKLSFVTASAADVAALRAAVRPVYDQLEQDRETRDLVAAITDMRDDEVVQPEPPRCSRVGVEAASSNTRIEGRWETTWTEAELLEAGLPREDARTLAGPKSAVFRAGRFRGKLGGGNTAIGAYEVDGPVVSLVFERGIGVQIGRVYQLRWSVYHDSITYAAVPGSEPLLAMLIKPWRRAR